MASNGEKRSDNLNSKQPQELQALQDHLSLKEQTLHLQEKNLEASRHLDSIQIETIKADQAKRESDLQRGFNELKQGRSQFEALQRDEFILPMVELHVLRQQHTEEEFQDLGEGLTAAALHSFKTKAPKAAGQNLKQLVAWIHHQLGQIEESRTKLHDEFSMVMEQKRVYEEATAMFSKLNLKLNDPTSFMDFCLQNRSKFDMVEMMGMDQAEGFQLLERSEEEFASTFPSEGLPERMSLCRSLAFNPSNARLMLSMSNERRHSVPVKERLEAVAKLKLNPETTNLIFSQTDPEFRNGWVYGTFNTLPERADVKTAAMEIGMNLHRWGLTNPIEALSAIQFHFPQLNRSTLLDASAASFIPLLHALFISTPNPPAHLSHPLMPSVNTVPLPRILSERFQILCNDGTIPPFSPDLKLFFSTNAIAKGAWIQFHGDGTTLFDIGGEVNFGLTLASLCPRDQPTVEQFDSSTVDDAGAWQTASVSSNYKISIKWE